jgi:hypothetical protein
MKGRRRQGKTYEYLKWLKEAEKEIERLELLWSAGIVESRDKSRYYSEIDPYCHYREPDIAINILRVIR